MKLGIFGVRADNRGLAYQTQSYVKHLSPDRVYGIGMYEDKLTPYPEDWRPVEYWSDHLTTQRYSRLDEQEIRRWLRGLSVVLGAETFYSDEFVNWARAEGVRTVLQINPEFVPWWDPRGAHLSRPDVILNPTTWRQKFIPGAVHLPFPVDRDLFPFRLRTAANHFVHVAGHRAGADRNGTRIVVGALSRLKGLNLTIRSQSPLGFEGPILRKVRLEQDNLRSPHMLYEDADIILLPRRYGGNCLVANEALSSGCPVVMLNRDPEQVWGGVYTVPARKRGQFRTKCGPIPLYDAQMNQLFAVIRRLQAGPQVVEKLSYEADRYASSISWDTLLPRYINVLKG